MWDEIKRSAKPVVLYGTGDAAEKILKELGLEGEYVGIGHLALGYAAEPAQAAAPRLPDRAFYLE